MTPPHHTARNIVLTGFMGTGKSTVGRLLAHRLGFDFVDTDIVIEEQHGTIATIFAEQGEAAFRSIEQGVARELSQHTGLVIATGGAMMLDPDNAASLSRNGRVFCLVATPEEILARVTTDASRIERPLLAVPDPRRRVQELLAERATGYGRFAQVVTGGREPASIATELEALARAEPQRFTVDSSTSGPSIWVGAALLPMVRELTGVDGPVVVVAGAGRSASLAPLLAPDLVVSLPPAGAQAPTADVVSSVHEALAAAGIGRDAALVALGSSADTAIAVGAAASYLDGLDPTVCPTDLAAIVDSIRPDRPARAVVADVATLQNLDPRVFSSDMASLLRHALIGDGGLLQILGETQWRSAGSSSLPRPLRDLEVLVAQAVRTTFEIVGRAQPDPSLDPLRLGQPFADAIGRLDPSLLDGEALGLGLVTAARLSEALGYLRAGAATQVQDLVAHLGLPHAMADRYSAADIVSAAAPEPSRPARRTPVVLWAGTGRPLVSEDIPLETIVEAVRSLQP